MAPLNLADYRDAGARHVVGTFAETLRDQLSKGESLHALRRQLHYAREGKVAAASPSSRTSRRGA